MREYTLNATFSGSEEEKYSIEEILRDKKKRSPAFIASAEKIEDLDRLTSTFESLEDIDKELYDGKAKLCRPFIIFDKSDDLSESKAIYDIVYKDDLFEIKNADNIKLWTIDYLLKNPSDIEQFYGLRTIYSSKHPGEMLTENLIRTMANSYFDGYEYSKIRNAYFTLKKLDPKDKKNEIHR